MSDLFPAWYIEAKVLGVWIDLTKDVLNAMSTDGGIKGGGPKDRCAGTGTFTFTLRNDERNSAQTRSYYSPGHANCMPGFDYNIPVRWRSTTINDGGFSRSGFVSTAFAIGTDSRSFFVGKIDVISPMSGINGPRTCTIQSVDWIDEAATVNTNVALQLNARSDQCATAAIAAAPTAPEATSIYTGDSTFKFAFDNIRDEKTKLLSALNALVLSEGGYAYVTGAGTVTVENRLRRTGVTSAFTLNNTMHGIDVKRARSDIYNVVKVTVHPRRVDTSLSVLYSLGTRPPLLAGQTFRPFGGYGDAANSNKRCGGTDMVAPVAGTDYSLNSLIDGSGTDLTGQLTVTASYTGNGASWVITNNGPSDGFLVKAGNLDGLQCRGKGIFDTTPMTMIARDEASITALGVERVLDIDMPYQDDPAVGDAFAQAILTAVSSPSTRIEKVSFIVHNSTLADIVLAYDIGSRFTVVEEQTGVSSDVYIQGIALNVNQEKIVTVTYTVAMAA